tara:strand:+ start:140 stop:253 length:114 start_codon:yes stop_codon:yes gene_type:complete
MDNKLNWLNKINGNEIVSYVGAIVLGAILGLAICKLF